ncbi:MAG TPA: CoA pyrophosphatase [Bacteroidia bacterium]|nr:CoA pyrophosphatase [Bacteroidia bacterium]
MIDELRRMLKHRLGLPLPGLEAQFRMAHIERQINLNRYKTPADAKKSGVLILLYEEAGRIKLPLILRTQGAGAHSGQVSLPGGKFELTDENIAATALRETQEEIGIPTSSIEVLGQLTQLYIPPSNFIVYPHVGILDTPAIFIPEQKEVVKVIPLDLESLLDEAKVKEKEIRLSSGQSIRTPYYNIEGEIVWGATAMILSELKSLLYEIGW